MMYLVTDLEIAAIQGIVVPVGDAAIAARLTGDWLESFGDATAAAYSRDLGHWHDWCASQEIDPLAARMSKVDKWIIEQRAAGVAKRTIGRRVSAVASWYDFLRRESDGRLTPHNPAKTKHRPNASKDDSPTLGLTPAQAKALIAAADADSARSSALIRFLLGNGLRVGSVTGALIENMAEDDGHHVIMLAGKGDTHRKVPIPPTVYAAIVRMLAERGYPTSGPLFATSTGRAVDRHYVFRLVRRLAAAAKIPVAGKLSPHSMRHTFATQALRRKPLHRVQQDMWHADPRTTEGYDRAKDGLEQASAYVVAADFEPDDGDGQS
jgi:integrase/recombinase XerD